MPDDHSDVAPVEVQHEHARDFLHNLALVVDAFDPKRRPSKHHVGIPEAAGKSLAYLLDLCRLWREPNDEFPEEFAAVQPTPVDCCGVIASSYHWLCWLLSQRILAYVCRALLPGVVVYHPGEAVASLEESHFVNADWQEVSHAVRLKSPGCVEILDVGKVDRLLTLLHQEYARAGYLLGKVHEPKEPPLPPAPLAVSLSPPRVTVEGIAYPVDDSAAQLVQALVEAGDWLSGSSVVNQPSRVVAGMPTEVRRLIESAPGKGMRIKPAAE